MRGKQIGQPEVPEVPVEMNVEVHGHLLELLPVVVLLQEEDNQELASEQELPQELIDRFLEIELLISHFQDGSVQETLDGEQDV